MPRITLFALALSFVLVAACQPTGEGDTAGIDALRTTHEAAFNAGDLDGLMDTWDQDAEWIEGNYSAATGHEAIREMYQGGPPLGSATMEISPEETHVAGDWASEWGNFRQVWTDEATGSDVEVDGRFAVLLERQPDDSWKISRLNTSAVSSPVEAPTYAKGLSSALVFENGRVIVQRLTGEAGGDWTGEHTHAGNQVVVFLSKTETTYRAGEAEWQVTREAGEAFWVEAARHEHRADTETDAVLITLK